MAVNAEQISCKNAVASIVAGAWEPVFRAMETGDEKCRIFSAPLPQDQKLHRHWRRRHFVEEIDKLRDRQLYDKFEAMVFEICVQLIDFLSCSFRAKSFLVA